MLCHPQFPAPTLSWDVDCAEEAPAQVKALKVSNGDDLTAAEVEAFAYFARSAALERADFSWCTKMDDAAVERIAGYPPGNISGLATHTN